MSGRISRQAWATTTRDFLLKHTLAQSEVDAMVAQRRMLQGMVGSYRAKAEASSDIKMGAPQVLLYGSAVAGTGFAHADADFCIVFPKSTTGAADGETNAKFEVPANSLKDIAGFAVVARESQPELLSDLHDHIRAQTPDVALQRIFRARIPIMQYIPSLSKTQLNNSKADGWSFKEVVGAAAKTAPQQTSSAASSEAATGLPNAPPPTGKRDHYDLSLSLDGVRNSLLLRNYMSTFPSLRVATMMLKAWGRQQHMLNARRGWLSPYAMTVMLIHAAHEAKLIDRLLPPSSADEHVMRVAEALLKEDSSSSDPVSALPEMTTALPPVDDVNAYAEAAEMLEGCFRYYGDVCDFDNDVVDIRSGVEDAAGAVDPNVRVSDKAAWYALQDAEGIDQKERWHRLGYEMLMIRDPFENHSLGRSVEFFRAEAIREAFRLAHSTPPDVNELCRPMA